MNYDLFPMGRARQALHHVRPRRVALPADVYHGVRELATSLQERGEVELVEPDRLEEGDLWWIETPSNPRCLITDLEAVATEASGRGVVTVCDSTFATPIALRPLSFGIDIVMHAATKAIATAVMLFGLSSGAALATVVGVLIEVPVMLMLVGICKRTANWFD